MPAPALTYRAATPADVPAVVALVESAYRGEASQAGWTSEAELLGGQRTDAEMIAATIARERTRILLAEEGGELRACCELVEPSPDGLPADPKLAAHGCQAGHSPAAAAYFGMFAVDPTLQGGGHGKVVLAEAERIAREELGASAMEMTVIRQRAELIAWYERRGYARTGELRPFP